LKSIEQKLQQCAGLIDTKDVTPFENGFLKGVTEFVEEHGTTKLSEKQVAVIERIYSKHFA
jgi:hypothetical protein